MKTVFRLALWASCAFGLLVQAPTHTFAGGAHTLRIATLAPAHSSAGRVFAIWHKQLAQLSEGRVSLDTYLGGVAGDERTVLRKMKLGQLDGGGMTTVGLGQVVRPALVLSAPGVLTSYAQMNAVQDQLDPHFEELFAKAGYKLLGFGDAGRVRYFSATQPIEKPSDLRSVRPWAWTDDAVYPALIKRAGANGVAMGLPEVMGALQTRMVDAVPTSALAAVGLQWFSVLKYVTERSDAFVVGALIVRREAFDALPPDVQKIVHTTAYANQKKIRDAIRREDDRAFEVLKARGLTPVAPKKHAAAWDAINRETTEGLVGTVYSRELLEQVRTIAARAER
jgi:TRAP-type C4-dicarboxylate transport system substrate-binding protein